MTSRASSFLCLIVLGCAGDTTPVRPERAPEGAESKDASVPLPEPDPRRWLAGDLHLHVAPLDHREGVTLDVSDITGLDFVVVTPHLWKSTWSSPTRRARYLAQWRDLATAARSSTDVTIIPGVEYGVPGLGHFGVSGVDLTTLDASGADFLAAARSAGAFVVVNHPFAVPTQIPGIPISEKDLSFRPWATGKGTAPALDGVEVWNVPLGLANLVSRPGGQTGEERAFGAADELARRERRRVTVVGGSDDHRGFVRATTWVLAADAGETSIVAALRAGATCVGSPDAGSLEARGDGDWVRIGETVRATSRVELRWQGRARLFVDGVDRGEHDGAFTHDDAAGVHTYRLVAGSSRCGFVYSNLEP
jgi:hypothetical protein